MKTFFESLCAGILITIGGSVFLSCENRYVGAVLFSVALLSICYKGYYLFTGKVGYLTESHTKTDFKNLAIGLFGNLLSTYLLGMLLRVVIPSMGETANTICSAKLQQVFWMTFVRAVFCGVLMYLSVSIFRDAKTPIAIIYCIPVFILSGFEHSIADMFYFGASGIFSVKVITFTVAVVLGNSVGGVLLSVLRNMGDKFTKS